MNAYFTVYTEEFEKNIEMLISNVLKGTKKATIAACEEILEDSLSEVPKDTETLASAGSYHIDGSSGNFTGTIGYGVEKDPMNPRTGVYASEYVVRVHDDLSVMHPNGKAKFLEDPVRRYQNKLVGKAGSIIRDEIGL